jgi:hypothetical protein
MRGLEQPNRRPRREQSVDNSEQGFGLVEVMAATVILMIVVISFTNLLIGSLSAGLLSRQRETAASIASNVDESAAALGEANLAAGPTLSSMTACTAPQLATFIGQNSQIPPTALFGQCDFPIAVDTTTYTVFPVISGAATLFLVNVTVKWTTAGSLHTYATTTQVGT